ncbi:nucleotidyltransferase family protein [Mariniflexile jejuense]|uniref:Nucleotidyltransferase family protein n=1 Tax=Mariniflexile jejuense TaxID=1173582 RepID=A0ABW3JDK2_9FLAO
MLLTKENKTTINKLCEIHNVDTLYLFGSATGTSFSKNSDIDFLVKFRQIDLEKYFENYLALKEKLKKLLKRDVDLVEKQTLRNPILINSINKNKELIYG